MKKFLLFAISIISAISFANAQSVFQGTTKGTAIHKDTPYDYSLNYSFTWDESDGTVTVDANFVWANGKPVGLVNWVNLYIIYDDREHPFNEIVFDNEKIKYSFAKEGGKFDNGETIKVRFYRPFELDAINTTVEYVIGSTSAADTEIGIIIKDTDIIASSSSALIPYDPVFPWNVNKPEDINYTVSYKDEANGIEGTSTDNPIGIKGLKPDTQYNMVFIASGTINGETYSSAPLTIHFWTLKEGEEPETAVTYSGSKSGSYKQGEIEYDYTLNCEITHNADGTLSFNGYFDWDNDKAPEGYTNGLSIIIEGIWSIGGDQKQTYTTDKTFDEGNSYEIIFQTAVALGDVKVPVQYTIGAHNGRLVNGGDITMQSAEINHRERTIKMNVAEGKLMATLYFDVPNNARNLYYKVEKGDAATLALDGYKKADTYNDYPVINLLVPPKGQTSMGSISFYQEQEDGFATTPVTYTYSVAEETPTGVEGILTEDGNAEFFNLNGVKVSNPENGIYIMVKDGKALKVIK